VDLAGLAVEDVRVEMVMGRINSDGVLEDTEVILLPAAEQRDGVAIFQKEVIPERTGHLGYALRISPNHFDDPLTRPCSNLLKWSPA
jgi:starch phosphorylase